MSDLERELELELHRVIDPAVAAPIPARRITPSGGIMKRLLGTAGAAVTVKVLTAVAVAAAAVTVAGAATETAITGSLNPDDWGKQVTQQVQTCKDTLRASGTRGIGQCVSQFAKQHGALVSSEARHHGQGNGDGNAKGGANGKDKGKTHGVGNGGVPPGLKNTPAQPPAAPES